ncbi:MAG: hypothetical protein FJX72_02685 [Armatimonadetes bacterium]|nr:hypothetical protein [Armatimonadota bacterium]
MTTARCLCGTWNLAFGGLSGPAPTTVRELEALGLPTASASVPGNFELDLQAAGLLPDPMIGMNMADLQQFDRTHLWFARRFAVEADPGLEPFLVFEGLDCYADIYLNGRLVGQADNMLVEWRFPVREGLLPENEIVVHIRPPLVEAATYPYAPGIGAMDFPRAEGAPYVRLGHHAEGALGRHVETGTPRTGFARAHRVVLPRDCGRRRRIRAPDPQLRDQADRTGRDLRDRGSRGQRRLTVFQARKRVRFGAGRLRVTALEPHLWWPRGRGDQPLYDVKVRLLRDGELVDETSFRHGIRTVELQRTETVVAGEPGEFQFVVNGERLYAMGANWVPADAFHSRDRERIPLMLALAEECGCNMLRCWGGNVYEDDLFYDLCDEKGLLVWQDFSLACAVYPQDDAFCARIADEATSVVRRLRGHACLALWAGDNECDVAYDWFQGSSGDPNNNRLTREVLPGVLRVQDPRRPYLPSSPYLDPAALRLGPRGRAEDHLWGPRDHYKSAFYLHSTCRFASEIGYHGCPSPESVRRFIWERPGLGDVRHHPGQPGRLRPPEPVRAG